jgi:alkylation response protein AidB-like acyl-CoA dehydrogenase
MNFGLSEEQELLQRSLAAFLDNECPPQHVRELFDGERGFEPSLWKGLAELGVAGLCVPEAFGGAGLEMIDLALAAEVLGSRAFPGPFLGHSLAALAIAAAGSEAQQERWLPRLASGELVGAAAFGEAGGAWQPEQWRARAASGRLAGAKESVPGAAEAGLVVVGVEGGGLAAVETDASGVAVEAVEGVDRTRRIARLRFDDAPCELLGGDTDAGPRVRDAALVLLAADAFGVASRLVEMAVDYSKTRVQFGAPIASFQAVKHAISNMAVEIEPARGLYWYAAHAFDHIRGESERSAALAKAHLTDRALQIARDTVELHGGIGFTWECDVQIWFKRAMFDRSYLGTPALHRERCARLAGW